MANTKRIVYFILYTLLLLAAFWRVEWALALLARTDNLSSYVLVIPAISALLLFWQRKKILMGPPHPALVMVFLLLGGIGLLGTLDGGPEGLRLTADNNLPALTFALTSFFIAGFAAFLGGEAFHNARFPLLFLYLMVPLPDWLETPLTLLLQYGSAVLAYLFMKLTIFPMYWENATVFNLPGFTIQVAEECSGIRSSLILLITTVLTSYLMLRTTKTRLILLLLALPIGIFRNAFRIWLLAFLAVYVDPNALSGPLHHHGGPVFFALALALLFVATWLLRRAEVRHTPISTLCRLLPLLGLVTVTGCSNAYRADLQMKRADRYYELKQYQEAAIEYTHVLRKETTNLTALCQLGRCHFELENLEQAFATLLRARHIAPDNARVQAILAELHQKNGEPEQARKLALTAYQQGERPIEMLELITESSRSKADTEQALQLALEATHHQATSPSLQATVGLLSLRLSDFTSAETRFRQALAIDPDFARGHLGLAMLHHAKGERDLAEAAYQRAAELAGTQSPEAIKWALFELEIGNPSEAMRIFETMAKQNPKSIFPQLQLIKIAMSEHRYVEAEVMATSLLRQSPNHLEARLLRAQSTLARGKFQAGLTELQQLTADFPQAWTLRYNLALAFLKTAAPDKAKTELKIALQLKPDYTDASLLLADLSIRTGDAAAVIPLLNALSTNRPNQSAALLLLGAAHQALGQFDRALSAYASLEQLEPQNPQPYYLAGLIQLKLNNRTGAVRAFTKAAETAPGFVLPLAQLVTLDLRDNHITQALARIDKAIQQAPDSGALSFLQGQVYLKMTNLKAAETSFLTAIKQDPESIAAYLALCKLYLASRREDQALQQLTEALHQNPNEPAALMLSALLLAQKTDFTTAAATYEELLKTKPDFLPALNNLACLYADKLNQLDKAHKLALRARELAPRDACVADTLGWILYRLGEIRWAASLLQESAAALPNEPDVLYHLALAQLSLGLETIASETLNTLLNGSRSAAIKSHASRLRELLELPQQVTNQTYIAKLQTLLQEDPANPAALVRMAAVDDAAGNTDAAIKRLETIRKTTPTYYPATLQLAQLLHKNTTPGDRAFELAKLAREAAPDDPHVAHFLGLLAYQKGQHKWALSLLLEAADKAPRNPELLYHLALAHYRSGQDREAQTRLLQALALNTPFPQKNAALEFLTLTDLSACTTNPGAALQQAERSLAKDPTCLPALRLSATAYQNLNNTSQTIRVHEKILSIYPDFPPSLIALASIYADSPADFDKAVATAQKARALLPDHTQTAKILGTLSLATGQYEYAAALLQEVVKKTPQDPEALLNLGVTRMKLNENEAARKAFDRVIASAPTSHSAESARQLLNELKQ